MAMALNAANCSHMSSVPAENSKTATTTEPNPPTQSVKGGLSVATKDTESVPPFMKTINDLQNLSSIMHTFHSRWDALQKHLDFIETAIETREKELVTLAPSHQPQDPLTAVTPNEKDAPSLTTKETTTTARSDMPGLQTDDAEQKVPTSDVSRKPNESYVENLCRTMGSRELRRYLVLHLSETSKLRQEVPAALKVAPNPPQLVLDCVGKFFLQGSKAFSKNTHMIPSRQAALLIMEYFLLMDDCNVIDHSVKQEAKEGAMDWRKRLIAEGGLCKAGNEDARGLLLLVACFGIPDEFTVEDLMHLLRLSGVHDISDALRKSSFLVSRVPEIIECMGSNRLEITAVDTVYTFGIEAKISPQKVLAPFLRALKELCKKARAEANGSPFMLKEANEKQLAALKSVRSCLEAHKVDPAKVMPGWKLNEKIANLEKDIVELNKKITLKRRAEQPPSFSVVNGPEFKHPRVITAESSAPRPSPFSSLLDPRVSDLPSYQLSARYSNPVTSHPTSHWPQEYANRSDNILSVEVRPPSSVRPSGMGAGAYVGPAELGTQAYGGPAELGTRAYVGPSELGTRAYAGPMSTFEEFRGAQSMPSLSAAGRNSASDLYNFADAVSEREFAHRPYNHGATPPAMSSYRSPFYR